MANHIFFRDAQLFRDGFLHTLRILSRSPQGRFPVFKICQRDHRLHRSVRQKRNVVVGLNYLATFGEHGICITNIAHYFAGIVGSRSQFVLVLRGVVGLVWPVVP